MTQNSSQEFQDREIVCREETCGKPFILTAQEAQWFAERNLHAPSRCKSCRANRKAMQQASQRQQSAQVAPPPATPADPAQEERRPGRHGKGRRRDRDEDSRF